MPFLAAGTKDKNGTFFRLYISAEPIRPRRRADSRRADFERHRHHHPRPHRRKITRAVGKEKYWYAEYFIEMPGTWSVEGDDLYQEKNVWPIIWLKAIGRYPHEQETYYDEKTTVTSVMIPELTTPDDKYNSALVERCQDMTFRVTQDERLVIYYRITPK